MAQQWEYCRLVHGSVGPQYLAYYGASGLIRRDLTAKELAKAWYALGMAGWEAVESGLFKRPVQPGRRIDDAAL